MVRRAGSRAERQSPHLQLFLPPEADGLHQRSDWNQGTEVLYHLIQTSSAPACYLEQVSLTKHPSAYESQFLNGALSIYAHCRPFYLLLFRVSWLCNNVPPLAVLLKGSTIESSLGQDTLTCSLRITSSYQSVSGESKTGRGK